MICSCLLIFVDDIIYPCLNQPKTSKNHPTKMPKVISKAHWLSIISALVFFHCGSWTPDGRAARVRQHLLHKWRSWLGAGSEDWSNAESIMLSRLSMLPELRPLSETFYRSKDCPQQIARELQNVTPPRLRGSDAKHRLRYCQEVDWNWLEHVGWNPLNDSRRKASARLRLN